MFRTIEEFDELVKRARWRFPKESKKKFVDGFDCACAYGALALTATGLSPKIHQPEDSDYVYYTMPGTAQAWAHDLNRFVEADCAVAFNNWTDVLEMNQTKGREEAWKLIRSQLEEELG